MHTPITAPPFRMVEAPKASVLLLGIGSVLMGDEGVGVHFVHWMQDKPGLEGRLDMVDGGTGGFFLMNYFEEYPTVILVDATLDGRPAGTLRLIQPRFSKDFPRALSTHDIGLRDVVEGLQVLGKLPKLYLFAVSIEKLQPMEDTLSPELAAVLPALQQQVLALLEEIESQTR